MFSKLIKSSYAIYTQIGQSVYGLIIILLTPLILNSSEQGIWYTLMALGALSRLADMGFLNLVVIYSAHSLNKKTDYSIDSVINYTRKLMRFSLILVFPIIFLIGAIVLSFGSDFETYSISWALYVVGLGCYFNLNYILSINEGMQLTKEIHVIRGLFFLVSGVFLSIFLYLDYSTLSLGIAHIVSFFLLRIFIAKSNYVNDFFFQMNSGNSDFHSIEFRDIYKKTMFSWTGGYLGTHGVIPIIYLFSGSFWAGICGLTFNIFIVMQNFANIFLTTINPKAIELISKSRNNIALRKIKLNLQRSIFLYIGLFFTYLFFIWVLEQYFSDRVLSGMNLLLIFLTFFSNITVFAISIYVRAHKEEPFGTISMISGTIAIISTYILSIFELNNLLMLGIFLGSFFSLLFAARIYRNYL